MEKKYRILGEFIKDISAETKDVESYIYTKENISKFKLLIDINTRPLKNKMAEVLISTKFKETDEDKQKSYFEMIYAVIVKIDEDVNTKEILEPIFLKEVPTEVYPHIFETFSYLFSQAGIKNLSIEKKVDFEKLYNERNKS